LGKSARKSIAFLFRLNYFLQYSKLCGENSILDKHDAAYLMYPASKRLRFLGLSASLDKPKNIPLLCDLPACRQAGVPQSWEF
jgi:hypothetical protein